MNAVELPTTLHLDLRSSTVLGVASTDPLDVDVDVTTDRYGLPYIPRHRISSRLRDAALRARGACPEIVAPAVELLGPAWSLGGGRGLDIDHARLPVPVQAAVAHALRSAEDSVDGQAGAILTPARIRDTYTEIRTGISRDAHGAPVPGTLRRIRALLSETVLIAPVTFTECCATPAHVRALAVMCAGVDQIGSGASRGTGELVCSFDGDAARTYEWAFGTGTPS